MSATSSAPLPTGLVPTDILTRDPELGPHIKALGLDSPQQYQQWCADHGFSTRLDKHWRLRSKERFFAAQQTIKQRLVRRKRERRHPRRMIERILRAEVDKSNLTQDYLVLIHDTAASAGNDRTRDAFAELVLFAEQSTGLLTTRPAYRRFGQRDGNTFIGGLLALARHRNDWLRLPGSWQPTTHNLQRQFSSLARHLLANYPVPTFMDSVWFADPSATTARQQSWYRRLAIGESPRNLDLPIRLTKKMVHHFLHAPHDYSVDAALRRAQVLGIGGSGRLANEVLGSRIGTDFEHDEFWESVIRWLIDHPMLDPVLIGPLVDYIYRRKFEPQHFADESTGFSIKGRDPASLLRRMRQWHTGLRKQPTQPDLQWCESGIGSLDWTEGDSGTPNHRRWTTLELLSRNELRLEGQAMRHCVASYVSSCALGGTSIWSLGLERRQGRRRRVMTIEVANDSRRICQIRGKTNRLPTAKEMEVIHRWAAEQKLTFAEYVAAR